MDDENELIQVTTRLPLNVKEKIDGLAESGGCSTAEIIRRLLDDSWKKYLDGVQYVDGEQGETIKELLGNIYTELSGMRTELHRIGVNYNQQTRLKHLENKFAEGKISVLELANIRQSIVEECKGFSPETINGIMDRFDTQIEEFANIMAYTRISHTRNGRAAIQYARGNGRGHNGHAKRNLLIGGVGMLPDDVIPFENQMAEEWERASGRNKNQVRRIVVSFSEKELNPQGEDSAYLALEMAQEFIEEAYPNRKAAIFVQNDGKGGKLHVHILVSNVDSMEYKGCTDEQTKFGYVKENFNRVAGRHITLDNGKKAKDKFTQTERALEEENEEAAENGGAAAYIWKDDLRERIQIAMENAASEDDFLEALEDEGVKARYGTSKRYGEYISYELVDVPPHMEGADRKYKARSYTLGDAYGVEALREKLREKANELLRMAEQHDNAAESKGAFSFCPGKAVVGRSGAGDGVTRPCRWMAVITHGTGRYKHSSMSPLNSQYLLGSYEQAPSSGEGKYVSPSRSASPLFTFWKISSAASSPPSCKVWNSSSVRWNVIPMRPHIFFVSLIRPPPCPAKSSPPPPNPQNRCRRPPGARHRSRPR